MRPTFWQKLDALARHQIPITLTLLLVLIGVIPSHVPGLERIGPWLSLISVYYWAVYRPDLLGYGAVFAIGLLEDILSGTPLGVGSLMLLLVHGGVVTQYKFFNGKSFAVTWWAFVVVAALVAFLRWLLTSALFGTFVSIQAPLFSYLMTVALYPVVGWMLIRVQLWLLREI